MRFQQKEKRKLEIVIASIDVFLSKGYTGSKISDIASQANMSVGLLFHYFKNKEALFNELTKIAVEGILLPLRNNSSDYDDFFNHLTFELFESIKMQPYLAKIYLFIDKIEKNNDVPAKSKELLSQVNIQDILQKKIIEGQKKEVIVNENPEILAQLYWSMVLKVLEYSIQNPSESLPNPQILSSIFYK